MMAQQSCGSLNCADSQNSAVTVGEVVGVVVGADVVGEVVGDMVGSAVVGEYVAQHVSWQPAAYG